MIIVPPSGKSPNRVLVVGEAPGREEYERGEPFVGAAGREQNFYLSRHDLHSRYFRLTNVIQEYTEGNPDPTPEQIAYWTPHLIREIATCQPSIILAVGRFAARWFLGASAELDDCHGIPHLGGEFDSTLAPRAHGAIVLPIYHPAYGLYSPEAKSLINWDYTQFAYYLDLIIRNKRHLITFRRDEYAGRELYLDVTGADLATLLEIDKPSEIGLDTEGSVSNPWSIQISTSPGTAYVLRCSQPDFSLGITSLQTLADANCLFVLHTAGTPSGCMFDIAMCRAMGLDLSDARIFDTMYAAFLLRTESKGLKSLSHRWLGMQMDDYMSLVEGIGKAKQIDYLNHVIALPWPKPETRTIRDNDGTTRNYTPKSITSFANAILRDIANNKVNKDGELTNPYERWVGSSGNKGIDRQLRRMVDAVLGPMPTATLDDVQPRSKAIFYAGRDSDATLRLRPVLSNHLTAGTRELQRLRLTGDLQGLFSTGMGVLPMLEHMQYVGMPASRSAFAALADFVDNRMLSINNQLSAEYFNGQPINANSTDDVNLLLDKLNLKAEKTTSTGKQSTGKKSIEHLRFQHPAIELVFQFREHSKIKSTYVGPILQLADESPIDPDYPDLFTVHTNIKPVTVASRRLSTEKPSLLNIPVRTELGRKVRACYQTYPYETFSGHDYSGQEARIAAHVCNSPLMIHLFCHCRYCGLLLDQNILLTDKCRKSKSARHEGGDIHAETAYRVFGIRKGDVDDETYKYKYRIPSKTGFFGILNGMQGLGLLDQFRMYIPPQNDPDGYWAVKENCESLVNEIREKVYPELGSTARAVAQEIRRTGRITDLYGMIRYLPSIYSRKISESEEAARQGFNLVIQGTAQGQIQNAMAWLWPMIREMQKSDLYIHPCLQVHDELLNRIDPYLYPAVDQMVIEAFTRHYGGPNKLQLKVPIEVDGHTANNWSDLK